jgi:predicted nuclease of predicted toxin-antitoxin system
LPVLRSKHDQVRWNLCFGFVRFLIDAQLPYLLCEVLKAKGFEALHTSELPAKNATTDGELNRISIEEDWILITKDNDFRHSHLLSGVPRKLILLRVGNTRNNELLNLFRRNMDAIVSMLLTSDFIEITSSRIVQHGKIR